VFSWILVFDRGEKKKSRRKGADSFKPSWAPPIGRPPDPQEREKSLSCRRSPVPCNKKTLTTTKERGRDGRVHSSPGKGKKGEKANNKIVWSLCRSPRKVTTRVSAEGGEKKKKRWGHRLTTMKRKEKKKKKRKPAWASHRGGGNLRKRTCKKSEIFQFYQSLLSSEKKGGKPSTGERKTMRPTCCLSSLCKKELMISAYRGKKAFLLADGNKRRK